MQPKKARRPDDSKERPDRSRNPRGMQTKSRSRSLRDDDIDEPVKDTHARRKLYRELTSLVYYRFSDTNDPYQVFMRASWTRRIENESLVPIVKEFLGRDMTEEEMGDLDVEPSQPAERHHHGRKRSESTDIKSRIKANYQRFNEGILARTYLLYNLNATSEDLGLTVAEHKVWVMLAHYPREVASYIKYEIYQSFQEVVYNPQASNESFLSMERDIRQLHVKLQWKHSVSVPIEQVMWRYYAIVFCLRLALFLSTGVWPKVTDRSDVANQSHFSSLLVAGPLSIALSLVNGFVVVQRAQEYDGFVTCIPLRIYSGLSVQVPQGILSLISHDTEMQMTMMPYISSAIMASAELARSHSFAIPRLLMPHFLFHNGSCVAQQYLIVADIKDERIVSRFNAKVTVEHPVPYGEGVRQLFDRVAKTNTYEVTPEARGRLDIRAGYTVVLLNEYEIGSSPMENLGAAYSFAPSADMPGAPLFGSVMKQYVRMNEILGQVSLNMMPIEESRSNAQSPESMGDFDDLPPMPDFDDY